MMHRAGVLVCAVVAVALGATAFEVDLSGGSANGGVVENGQFTSKGWQVTAVKSNRIVWRTTSPIPAGSFEADILIDASPHSTQELTEAKLNYFGAYENSAMQHYCPGDKAYSRVGQTKYKFSRIKAENGPFVEGSTPEPSIGETSQWKTDGTTVNRVKWTFGPSSDVEFSWNGNVKTLDRRIDNLQYFFVGCDKSYSNAVPRMVFARVKITSSDGTEVQIVGGATPVEHAGMAVRASERASAFSVVNSTLRLAAEPHSTVRLLLPNGSLYRTLRHSHSVSEMDLSGLAPGCYVMRIDGASSQACQFTVR
jgi:hypothetical protein